MINLENLALVRRKLGGRTLERHKHSMRLGTQANYGRPLLYGLQRVFHLMQAALRRDCEWCQWSTKTDDTYTLYYRCRMCCGIVS